jgi:hypothetical protein
MYGPTDKAYMPSTGVCQKHGRQGRLVRVHKSGFICNVIQNPKNNIRWEKSHTSNNTTYSDLHWNTDLGTTTIRMISSKKGSKVVFWIPMKYLDDDQLSRWGKTREHYIEVFWDEFQKRYDCKLGPIREYQKEEYAFVEDPEFLFLAEKYNLKTENAWTDRSEGSVEWETDNIELAKAKIEMPERLLRLESNVSLLIKTMERMEFSVNCLLKIFDSPQKKDEFVDVV